MQLEWTEEQTLIRDQAQRLLAECGARARTRDLLDRLGEIDQNLWQHAVETGWTAVPVPEEYQGLGLGMVELALIAEQIGREAASVPFLASTVLVTEALIRHGNAAQRAHWLPQLAAGKIIGCFGYAPAPIDLRQERLHGTLSPVLAGACAGLLVAPAQTVDGTRLVLCELKDVRPEATSSLDNGRGYARLALDGVRADVLGASRDGMSELSSLLDSAALIAAFEALGGADTCLSMARDYALTRKAFGQPIGAFQAIKHRLADAYALIEVARGNALYALWQRATGSDDCSTAVCAAYLSAIKACEFIARENIQIHGGFGVTWEADCHLYYRRARALALDLGGLPYWRDRLVDRLAA